MLSLLSDSGRPVDWWFLYKVPRILTSSQSAAASGYEYLYYDAPAKEVALAPARMTSGKGALDFTLAALIATGWILSWPNESPR